MDLPKIYNYKYRLLKETDISAEFARNHKEFFDEYNIPFEIHADYNSMENHKSNVVITEASNYMKHLSLNIILKPIAYGASYAAVDFG
jgi:predicted RNase H-related nuclease YkuK (DUF458 family)